jgi:hypothetical protein
MKVIDFNEKIKNKIILFLEYINNPNLWINFSFQLKDFLRRSEKENLLNKIDINLKTGLIPKLTVSQMDTDYNQDLNSFSSFISLDHCKYVSILKDLNKDLLLGSYLKSIKHRLLDFRKSDTCLLVEFLNTKPSFEEINELLDQPILINLNSISLFKGGMKDELSFLSKATSQIDLDFWYKLNTCFKNQIYSYFDNYIKNSVIINYDFKEIPIENDYFKLFGLIRLLIALNFKVEAEIITNDILFALQQSIIKSEIYSSIKLKEVNLLETSNSLVIENIFNSKNNIDKNIIFVDSLYKLKKIFIELDKFEISSILTFNLNRIFKKIRFNYKLTVFYFHQHLFDELSDNHNHKDNVLFLKLFDNLLNFIKENNLYNKFSLNIALKELTKFITI